MRPLPFLVLAVLLAAGCAEKPESTSDVPLVDDGEFDGLDATETTGVIRGVVVDEAVRPISDAVVSLTGTSTRNATSSDSGAFGFDGLEPGTYFLTTNKPGYRAVQSSAEVIAGIAEPPIVKVVLVADPASTPYYSVVVWNGFLECSMRAGTGNLAGSVGVNVCSTGTAGVDPFPNQFAEFPLAPMDRLPDLLQGEMIWESTQAFGSGLSFVVGPPSCTDIKYNRADGASPLVIRMNGTEIEEDSADALDDGFKPEEGVCYRAFSYTAEESAHTVGLVLSQKFDAYFHAFYNMLPPEGWQFSVDGDPPMP